MELLDVNLGTGYNEYILRQHDNIAKKLNVNYWNHY